MHDIYEPKYKKGNLLYYFFITNKEGTCVYRDDYESPFGMPVWNVERKCSEGRLLDFLSQIGIECKKLELYKLLDLPDGVQAFCITGVSENVKDYDLVSIHKVAQELDEHEGWLGYRKHKGTEVWLWRLINTMLSDALLSKIFIKERGINL